jgi:hypothetical protein
VGVGPRRNAAGLVTGESQGDLGACVEHRHHSVLLNRQADGGRERAVRLGTALV